ncbi:MAG: prepilin-type N-terminal cleavage/methylation domain-containing protein [Proteobacteria bacterium]|nr:prepilin-type N-terminal cleavage/methylation domain-containing protein [Pseudomonadota bacterium]
MTKKASQRGFTLFEVMVASLVGMLVLLPAIAMLFRVFTWYDDVRSQLALNRHARAAFDVLGDGARLAVGGTDQTPNVYGIRGRQQAPSGGLRSNYRLQYSSNNLTVTPDILPTMQVTCTGAGTPLPDCGTSGEVKNVDGWIGEDVNLNASSRSVGGRTVEVMLTITDPYAAQRLENPALATERYRTIFTLNRDEADP